MAHMTHTTHTGRITAPVAYARVNGDAGQIPIGPCLIEQYDSRSVDIFWGELGNQTAVLTLAALEAAEQEGHLVVLD